LRGELRNDSGAPAPTALFSLGQTQLTVPAKGTASVTATLDVSGAVPVGFYDGVIVATGSAGPDPLSVRVPVGLRVLPQLRRLTVRLVKPRPADEIAYLGISPWNALRVDDQVLPWSEPLDWKETSDPNVLEASALVPDGAYKIGGNLSWIATTGSTDRQGALVSEPEVTVDGSTTAVIDLRKLVPIKVGVDRPRTEVAVETYAITRTTASGLLYGSWSGYAQWAYPTAKPTIGAFKVKVHKTLAEPQAVIEVSAGGRRLTVQPSYLTLAKGVPDRARALPKFDSDRTLQVATIEDVRAGRDVRGKLVFADLRALDPIPMPPTFQYPRNIANELRAAIDAGAAGVLMTSHLFPYILMGPAEFDDALRIPLLWLDRPEAEQLEALLANAQRPARAEVNAELNSPYEYKLWFHELDRVPNRMTYSLRTRDLKRVDTDYRWEPAVNPNESSSYEASHVYRPEDAYSIGYVRRFDTPLRRAEYYNVTGPDVLWSPAYTLMDWTTGGKRTGGADWLVTDRRPSEEVWNAAPAVPGQQKIGRLAGEGAIRALCAACRQADTLWFYPAIVEGPGVHTLNGMAQPLLRLSRDGVEIPAGRTGHDFALPSGAGRYHLDNTWRMAFTGSAYPRLVETSWDFGSAGAPAQNSVLPPYATAGQAYLGDTRPADYLPLIFLNYDVPLALDNTARAGRALRFVVHATGSRPGSAASVRGLKLSVSYDDGATWRSASVRTLGDGRYDVRLAVPRVGDTSGAVSLRTVAWDVHGNQVTQTATRAFGLRR
jgi:hypothetical protein